jgi:hypothetical protein
VKPRPRAKAKAKGKTPVEQQLEVFKQATEARYKLAMQAYKAQDMQTQDALDLIVERLRTISTGQIRIFPNGKSQPGVVMSIEPALQDQNVLFLATEIMKDLAFFDVKVANYEFPSVYCAECGDKLTPSKRVKAQKRRATKS